MTRPGGVALLLLAACASSGAVANPPAQTKVVIDPVQAKPVEIRPVFTHLQLYRMPLAEALPSYREKADDGDEESIMQLAWARDLESVPRIAIALAKSETRLVAAQALAELADPRAKPMLLAALTDAKGLERAAILWALVVLHDDSIVDEAVRLHAASGFDDVTRLDGDPAFEPERLAELIPVSKATTLAASSDPALRNIGFGVLVRQADTKTPAVVATALAKADRVVWSEIVSAVFGAAGGRGLALLLDTVPKGSRTLRDDQLAPKSQTHRLFELLRTRADPRASDILDRFRTSTPHPHWKTLAAICQAEVGDVRAASTLAWRVGQDTHRLYVGDDSEYGQSEQELHDASLLLGDLAALHPAERARIAQLAYPSVSAWLARPPPSFKSEYPFELLAALEAREALPLLRKMANPAAPLPAIGAARAGDEWRTAMPALAALGALNDPSSWTILQSQLERRPAKFDGTQESLVAQHALGLGQALIWTAFGAADGFAASGDSRAFPLLVKYVEDPLNHDGPKAEAAIAAAEVATDAQMREIASKLRERADAPLGDQWTQAMAYTEALKRKPAAALSLFDLVDPATDNTVRMELARAIGLAGLAPEIATRLRATLADPKVNAEAAVALVLGGTTDDARFVVASYPDVEPMTPTGIQYGQFSAGFRAALTRAHYDNGVPARIVANADAAFHVKIKEKRPAWYPKMMREELSSTIRRGPKPFMPIQLHVRLMRDAETNADARRLLRYYDTRRY